MIRVTPAFMFGHDDPVTADEALEAYHSGRKWAINDITSKDYGKIVTKDDLVGQDVTLRFAVYTEDGRFIDEVTA